MNHLANRANAEGMNQSSICLSHEEMAYKISELEQYSGGYMYSHQIPSLNGERPFHHRVHWVKDYDTRSPEEFIPYNTAVLSTAYLGSTISIKTHREYVDEEVYLLTIDGWEMTEYTEGHFIQEAQDNLNQSCI